MRYDTLDRFLDFMGLQTVCHKTLQKFMDTDWRIYSKTMMAELYARNETIDSEVFKQIAEEFGFKKKYEIRNPDWIK